MKPRFRDLTAVVFLVATLVASLFAGLRLRLENDLVSSLVARDPGLAAVFEEFQGSGLFRGKIFVDFSAVTDPTLVDATRETLSAEGYVETSLAPALTQAREDPGTLLAGARDLSLHLPPGRLAALTENAAVDARAHEILASVLLPGGEGFAGLAQGDPLGASAEALATLMPGNLGEGAAIRAFASPRPFDFPRIERAREALQASGARFIGEDFFAYENYAAIKRDILVCSLLGLPLNILLYLLFIRDLRFLAFTLAGNLVSYAWALFLATLFFPGLYGVALAFTTTFLSFNNEYLVHLAGIGRKVDRGKKLGLLSAVGTTFLGFLVLLAGSSELVRQMALLSLGGMGGFLAFLWVFRGTLERVNFRESGAFFARVNLRLGTPVLLGLAFASLAAAIAAGLPEVGTKIRAFRNFSPGLEADIAHFSARATSLSGGKPLAVEIGPEFEGALSRWNAQGQLAPHSPWAVYAPMARQNANATLWSERAPLALARLDSFLRDAGVGIDFTGAPPVPRDPAAFCALVEGYSPLRACARGPGGDLFAIVTLTPASAAASSPARWAREAGGRAWSLDAEPYYDSILTGFSRELGWLFLVGLAAMACYLYALHRSLRALLYIFLPVLLAATVVSIWLSSGRGEVNVIHMLAFSLVIALGVDYSSVALSSRYSAGELSRVLITGLSTLAGFGALAAAKHPVLRDLGMVVSLGAGMSLAFALFVRFLPEVRDAP